jgi:hypothetical protein
MEFTSLRLLARQDIKLQVCDGNGTKFVSLFRSCWRQVPRAARRAILKYWRTKEVYPHPLIELSNVWTDSATSFAQVRRCGMELRFSAKDFDILPPSVAC